MKKWLERNREWAEQKCLMDADYFSRLSKGQSPTILWIGCCDSRVIPTELCSLTLGDVFVQTNIANQVKSDDQAMVGAINFAVDVLKVQEIVVCGHTQCGGIHGSLHPSSSVPESVAQWVKPLTERYSERVRKGELTEERVVELNVRDQIEHIKALWGDRPNLPPIIGLVFRMDEGRLYRLTE